MRHIEHQQEISWNSVRFIPSFCHWSNSAIIIVKVIRVNLLLINSRRLNYLLEILINSILCLFVTDINNLCLLNKKNQIIYIEEFI